ncbi:MAG: (5-formylfuran-3-yl)methyl phosphate synthase [Hyphomicrobiales bacterium]|nr:(5-formylfuran-3-yl)methyl phosphate synthase [Hyphomicrobiales bacterium]
MAGAPLFLASVRNADEARIALAAGADLIDAKDPAAGALGAARDLAAVVAAVGERKPVSATAGDLPMRPDVIAAAASERASHGVRYVKIGVFEDAEVEACVAAAREACAGRAAVIAVLFADLPFSADWSTPHRLLALARAGAAGVMLDTADKARGPLTGARNAEELGGFVAAARAAGLISGLAGGLRLDDIALIARAGPDYAGFRGALCGEGGREAALDARAAAAIRRALNESAAKRAEETARRVTMADHHILAGRFYAPHSRQVRGPLDKIFVRDLVLDAHIGVYSLEYGVTQRVRIGVDVECYPSARPLDENIDNVLNYDYVVDGARAIIGSGHIQLVETVAERLAEHCLKHRRAATVRVSVEKLDRIEGASLGVEIFRRQPPAREANVYPLLTNMRDGDER